MNYRPLTMIAGCPSCGDKPRVRYRLFKGARAECKCGVCGPFVPMSEWPEHHARAAWAVVAGKVAMSSPPPMPRK